MLKPPSEIFQKRFFEYRSENSNCVHYALLIYPADGAGNYPVIQNVYGGPSVQVVRDSWFSVSQYIKFVSLGYAVLFVDGRGSANRGSEFEGGIKHHLGFIEVEDQAEGLLTVAKLTGSLLDTSRVCVTGWSYGGYMSILMLAHHPSLYRGACAGGAVSDWTLYDTCYTERYMGLPKENEVAYKTSGLLGRLNKLPDEDGRLLIVHGMIDENVHFSHTEKIINGLITAGKPHSLQLFPGERHAIRNGDAIEHLHARMIIFFNDAIAKSQ